MKVFMCGILLVQNKNPLQPIDCNGLCVVERGGIDPVNGLVKTTTYSNINWLLLCCVSLYLCLLKVCGTNVVLFYIINSRFDCQ